MVASWLVQALSALSQKNEDENIKDQSAQGTGQLFQTPYLSPSTR